MSLIICLINKFGGRPAAQRTGAESDPAMAAVFILIMAGTFSGTYFDES
jgi:hypothetical protein